jgi:hypothetical protein
MTDGNATSVGAGVIDKTLLLLALFGTLTHYQPSDDALSSVLATLSPKERSILKQRYSPPFPTLDTIGLAYPRADGGIGVTKETVRQIEAKALRKLRHPRRANLIWPGRTKGNSIINWAYVRRQMLTVRN